MSPLISVSVVTPKPGCFDEFMELQVAQQRRLRGKVPGLRGSRLYRGLDGRSVVIVGAFETAEDQIRFAGSVDLLDHISRVRSLIESTRPALYETAYDVGDV